MERGYTIHELADHTGLTPRTIHFYIAQGLLPSAGRRGPGTRHPVSSLSRLIAIVRLKDEVRLSLREIRQVLRKATESSVHAYARGEAGPEAIGVEVRSPALGRSPAVGRRPAPGDAAPRGGVAAPPGTDGGATPERRPAPLGTPDTSSGPAAGGPPGLEAPATGAGDAGAQLESLVKGFEYVVSGTVPRAGSRDYWLTVPVTRDIVISARRVTSEEIEKLRRVADYLRIMMG